jgi:hypothetical protein
MARLIIFHHRTCAGISMVAYCLTWRSLNSSDLMYISVFIVITEHSDCQDEDSLHRAISSKPNPTKHILIYCLYKLGLIAGKLPWRMVTFVDESVMTNHEDEGSGMYCIALESTWAKRTAEGSPAARHSRVHHHTCHTCIRPPHLHHTLRSTTDTQVFSSWLARFVS